MRACLAVLVLCVPAAAWAGPTAGQRTEEELLAELERVPELRMFSDEEVLAAKQVLADPRVRQAEVSPFLRKLHEDLVLRGVREGLPLKKVRDSQMNPAMCRGGGQPGSDVNPGLAQLPAIPDETASPRTGDIPEDQGSIAVLHTSSPSGAIALGIGLPLGTLD